MILVTGEIVEVSEMNEGRVATVRVGGAMMTAALDLLPSAKPGDAVLIEAGVAISLLRPEQDTT